MQIPQEMPPYRIIRNAEGESILFSDDDIVGRFDSEWVSGHQASDVSFIAKAASSYPGLVAAVQASLDLLPEMNLTASKAEQLKNQLEQAIGVAMQDVHVLVPNELERRKKELESKLADLSSQSASFDQSVMEDRQKMSGELQNVECLLQYCY